MAYIKKNSKNVLLRCKFFNALLFLVSSLVFEVMFCAFSFGHFLPPLFFLDLLLIICAASIIFLFKSTIFDKIYIPILLFVINMAFALNAVYYNVTKKIFTLENLSELSIILGRAGDHSGEFSWPMFSAFLATYIVIIAVFFVINLKFFHRDLAKNNSINHRKIGLIALVTSVTVYSLGVGITTIIERNQSSYIDSVSKSPVYTTKKIGLLSYYVKNLGQLLFPPRLEEKELLDYFTNSSFLHDDFTGKLSGYNVITITIETGGDYMLNQYTTPNLYKLLNEGINCSHEYSKNGTFWSELLSITGNTPGDVIDMNKSYVLPFGLPELFNSNDYDTVYFADIGNNNDVYGQKPLMPTLGYKKCYFHYDLMPDKEEYNYDDSNWERDSDVFKLVVDKMKELKNKFYVHYTTMCMHGAGGYPDTPARASLMDPLKKDFKAKLDNLESTGKWVNPLKGNVHPMFEEYYYNYTLCTMDFDLGLGILLDYLEQSNLLDKTLLILYGDHDCYAGTNPPMSWEIKGNDNADEVTNYSTILGFYNPTLGRLYNEHFSTHEFTKFTSPMVIVPTILDLLGIKYNPKFYQGKSIFDPTYDNEVFYTLYYYKFWNENYLSDIGTTIDKTFLDNGTQKEFLEHCANFLEQKKYIDYIYANNVFKTSNYDRFMPAQ